MRIRFALLLAIAATSMTAAAQSTARPVSSGPELSLEYTYLRSNAPVDQCGCFSPQGGRASFAYPLPGGHFSLAGDVTAGHAGKIAAHDYDLTLTTFTAGVRYRHVLPTGRLEPFGQVLAGGAHAGGSLVEGNTAAANPSVVFASNVGGGLDLRLRPESRISWRAVEADYLVTLFHNGQNDHQNILQLSTGIAFHFSRR
ncbi:outer membrane beta-barrel protein [Occallatibacter riparius]|uniref:Outer membrane protein beta-barrel domain-containing protein n=1 Tax=Occallatibacter riparius TaxID=1002689 RepID=A0A9J7BGM3_9BACT|nr:outer membrane beta-barrel protein [Occallatibacter riparius]UWZ81936.1 hypothetical protein MOP44_15275 [Occallatibacter riparius]